MAMEDTINGIAGVVTVGLFAHRGADVLLVAGDGGIETILPHGSQAAGLHACVAAESPSGCRSR